MNTILPLKDEVYEITGAAMSVINSLGHGYAEKIYENAMVVELERKNISYTQQAQYEVLYEGVKVGHYIPDLVVNVQIIVEIKTIDKIGVNEIGQVLNYLKVTGLTVGLILNFKNQKLEWKRVVF